MTPEHFRRWTARMCEQRQWTRAQLAAALGVSDPMLRLYVRGRRYDNGRPVAVPKTVELAMVALELGFTAYDEKEVDMAALELGASEIRAQPIRPSLPRRRQ